MNLYIDTAVNPFIEIILEKEKKEIAKIRLEAKYLQAEKLLLTIDGLLSDGGLAITDIKKVFVKEAGDSFSALRIGVLTANALAYALGVPINNKTEEAGGIGVVSPLYGREPNITLQKRKV